MILFISDLHLSPERPHITRLLLAFLATQARAAQALYILGDLFEYWAGDDDIDDAHHRPVVDALLELKRSGCKLYFMHGNRDFLIGAHFAQASGVELLPDPLLIDLFGRAALLTHGDMLCTDDVDYQTFRAQVRKPQWQKEFLAQPLVQRKSIIEQLRSRSEQEKSHKSDAIMDVNADAVTGLLRRYDIPPLLIHGHTHRPAHHHIEIDGATCERIVLADWGDSGSYLCCDAKDCETVELKGL